MNIDLDKYIHKVVLDKKTEVISYIFNIEIGPDITSGPYKNLVHMFRHGRLYSDFISDTRFKRDIEIMEDDKTKTREQAYTTLFRAMFSDFYNDAVGRNRYDLETLIRSL